MRVRQPDVQPNCSRSGGIRYHTEIRRIGETEWRFLLRQYDVASGAGSSREVMARLRITRIWRSVQIFLARGRQENHVGASRNGPFPTQDVPILDHTPPAGSAVELQLSHGIDVLGDAVLRHGAIAGSPRAGAQFNFHQTDRRSSQHSAPDRSSSSAANLQCTYLRSERNPGWGTGVSEGGDRGWGIGRLVDKDGGVRAFAN